MSTQNRQFAFGKDTYHGCNCPASEAGYLFDDDNVVSVAKHYDDVARQKYDQRNIGGRGTITEQQAKDAWMQMISRIEARYGDDDPRIDIAKEIAAKLGW